VTALRSLGPDFDPLTVDAIDRRLQFIKEAEHATVLLAVESGSRAWGFPSPDSDYDCRFIYLRRRDDYLSLVRCRDVIEIPLDGALDIGGWDLGKALLLLLKGNAVVIEWLTSPFVYAGDRRFRAECLALARAAAQPASLAHHYLHLGERQRRSYFADLRSIQLKKVFYALRPAMALRWLRMHPEQTLVPMHFPTLVEQTDLSLDVLAFVEDLLMRKAATRELGSGPLPPAIAALIDEEFSIAREIWPRTARRPNSESLTAANVLFRRWIAADSASPPGA
jgi:predicted nucleotidyltransferase